MHACRRAHTKEKYTLESPPAMVRQVCSPASLLILLKLVRAFDFV